MRNCLKASLGGTTGGGRETGDNGLAAVGFGAGNAEDQALGHLWMADQDTLDGLRGDFAPGNMDLISSPASKKDLAGEDLRQVAGVKHARVEGCGGFRPVSGGHGRARGLRDNHLVPQRAGRDASAAPTQAPSCSGRGRGIVGDAAAFAAAVEVVDLQTVSGKDLGFQIQGKGSAGGDGQADIGGE